MRLLTATFTTKPMSQLQDRAHLSADEDDQAVKEFVRKRLDLLQVLCTIVPKLPVLFPDHDRISTILTSISNSVVINSIKSRSYPDNMSMVSLKLMLVMLKSPALMKNWKRDVSDAFYDNRFTRFTQELLKDYWIPILHQWTALDKDCMNELVSRLSAPSSAGIMFGVGAASARLENDRKTQQALRRLAFLILSSSQDRPLTVFSGIETKLNELLTATPSTSPSSATKADTYIVLRALILQCSEAQLITLWSVVTTELQAAFGSLLSESSDAGKYNTVALLHAAKLLDLLVVTSREDFQLHEWLFITDTIDAVYRPSDWSPTALADDLAESLAPGKLEDTENVPHPSGSQGSFLDSLLNENTSSMTKEELVNKVLRPFFGHLSIASYEATYRMSDVNVDVQRDILIRDLSDQKTLL